MSAATESAAMETDAVTGQKRPLDTTVESKAEEPPAKRARVDEEAKQEAAPATEEKQEAQPTLPKVTVALCADLKRELEELITSKSCAPIMVRLAWHDAGTYCAESRTGGPRACMRHDGGEAGHGANNGLEVARGLIAPIVEKYTGAVSVADLWAFAGCIAVKACGGPDIPFRFGRSDAPNAEAAAPDGRLPDALQGAEHLKTVFGRMGLSIREIVALSGAHTLGRCHQDRSGFEGEWTANPLSFDNSYFTDLLNKTWTLGKNEASGNAQYTSEDGKIMLPSDFALVEDPTFKGVLQVFADNQEKFFEDFAVAFAKLVELGCDSLYAPVAEAQQ